MSDTQPPTLPPPTPEPVYTTSFATPVLRFGTAFSRVALVLVALVVVALLAVSVFALVPASAVAERENPNTGEEEPLPYSRVPAGALPVKGRIEIGADDELEVYPPDGNIFLVTISEPAQSALSSWLGRDDPSISPMTEIEKYGVQTPQQRRTVSLEQMRTSEQVAQYVALQRLGYDVSLTLGEVLVQGIVCLEANTEGTECLTWSPSDKTLDPGDKIVEVEGQPVETVDELSAVLEGRSPGDVVEMKIERSIKDGIEDLTVDVELTASPEDPNRTIVGFYPFDTRQVVLPFDLAINTGSIGGPSAGLAFTLTLVDELSPGELTGGQSVAVTGTIDLEGRVGPIGGLAQKVSAVRQRGIETFLVPTSQTQDELDIARQVAGDDVEIIPVSTLDEAIEVLVNLGGDPLPN